MKRKYIITLSGQYLMSGLIKELNHWGVKPESYTVNGATITTNNNNAVDVVAETFMNHPNLVKIEIAVKS